MGCHANGGYEKVVSELLLNGMAFCTYNWLNKVFQESEILLKVGCLLVSEIHLVACLTSSLLNLL